MCTPVSSDVTTVGRRRVDRGASPGIEADFGPARHLGERILAVRRLRGSNRGSADARRTGPGKSSGNRPWRAGADRTASMRRLPAAALQRAPGIPGTPRQGAGAARRGASLRRLDPLVHADRVGLQDGRQRQTAVRAGSRTEVNDRIRLLPDDAAVALVAGLGATGAGLLATLLAIGQGRRGGRARRLGRALQLQHRINQLVLAQALEVTPAPAVRNQPSTPRASRRRTEATLVRCRVSDATL